MISLAAASAFFPSSWGKKALDILGEYRIDGEWPPANLKQSLLVLEIDSLDLLELDVLFEERYGITLGYDLDSRMPSTLEDLLIAVERVCKLKRSA